MFRKRFLCILCVNLSPTTKPDPTHRMMEPTKSIPYNDWLNPNHSGRYENNYVQSPSKWHDMNDETLHLCIVCVVIIFCYDTARAIFVKSLSGSEVPKQLLHSLIPCFLHQFSLKNQNKHVLNITPPDPTQPVPSLPVSCSFHRHWEDIIRIFHKD